jgi:hypothetical protein
MSAKFARPAKRLFEEQENKVLFAIVASFERFVIVRDQRCSVTVNDAATVNIDG